METDVSAFSGIIVLEYCFQSMPEMNTMPIDQSDMNMLNTINTL
jgi:hypothetical protein